MKNIFLTVPRVVISTNRIKGTSPLRGQTRKVPRPQKCFNPIFSKSGREIFLKIRRIVDLDPFWQWAKKIENLFRQFLEKCRAKNFYLGGPCPQILSPIPDFIGQFCRPLRCACDGPLSSVYCRTVYEKFEFFENFSTGRISKTVRDELWPRYFSGSWGRGLRRVKVRRRWDANWRRY